MDNYMVRKLAKSDMNILKMCHTGSKSTLFKNLIPIISSSAKARFNPWVARGEALMQLLCYAHRDLSVAMLVTGRTKM